MAARTVRAQRIAQHNADERRLAFDAWQAQVNRAWRLGQHTLAARHRPREIAGAGEINRCAAALKAALDAVEEREANTPNE